MEHVLFNQSRPIGIRNIEKILADPLEPGRIIVWSDVQEICVRIRDDREKQVV